ncbi:hypothetical protein [Roseiterribacter gracilis]|uniref:Uncharacterized protein n=1 Tax=Roseiterribacter gracilis TaxID=2812848 RepID=A0A8S8X9N3_9PROT|nr:hypothetical protein TMPK1_05360 [Rhodospirillales bacterium TMPK1]
MRLKIERVGIVEAELQLLTQSLHGIAAATDAETTLAKVTAFLKIADKVIARHLLLGQPELSSARSVLVDPGGSNDSERPA